MLMLPVKKVFAMHNGRASYLGFRATFAALFVLSSRFKEFILSAIVNGSLKPNSHKVVWVVRVVKKDPKDKDSGLEYFVFWVFLHDLNYSNDLIRIRTYFLKRVWIERRNLVNL